LRTAVDEAHVDPVAARIQRVLNQLFHGGGHVEDDLTWAA
jgi:hypothetical protein